MRVIFNSVGIVFFLFLSMLGCQVDEQPSPNALAGGAATPTNQREADRTEPRTPTVSPRNGIPGPSVTPGGTTASPVVRSALTESPRPSPTVVSTRAPTSSGFRETTPTPVPHPTAVPTAVVDPTPVPTPVPDSLATVDNEVRLEGIDATAASAIRGLPWVLDGMDQLERQGVETLVQVAETHPGLFRRLINEPWVEDGIPFPDSMVVRTLGTIAGVSDEIAVGLLDGQFLDPDDPNRHAKINQFGTLARNHPGLLETIWVQPWVQDGMEPWEWRVIRDLAMTANDSPDAAKVIVRALSGDSFNRERADLIGRFRRLAISHPELLEQILQPTDIHADQTVWEREIAQDIAYIYRYWEDSGEYRLDRRYALS